MSRRSADISEFGKAAQGLDLDGVTDFIEIRLSPRFMEPRWRDPDRYSARRAERTGGRYGLVTMRAAGGMAPAIIIERI